MTVNNKTILEFLERQGKKKDPCLSKIERLARLDRPLFSRYGSVTFDNVLVEFLSYNPMRVYLEFAIAYDYTVLWLSRGQSTAQTIGRFLWYPNQNHKLSIEQDLTAVFCAQLIRTIETVPSLAPSVSFREILYRGT